MPNSIIQSILHWLHFFHRYQRMHPEHFLKLKKKLLKQAHAFKKNTIFFYFRSHLIVILSELNSVYLKVTCVFKKTGILNLTVSSVSIRIQTNDGKFILILCSCVFLPSYTLYFRRKEVCGSKRLILCSLSRSFKHLKFSWRHETFWNKI